MSHESESLVIDNLFTLNIQISDQENIKKEDDSSKCKF